MREMLLHIHRHRNKVVFMKCLNSSCSHCTKNPLKAKKLFAMLEKMDMKLFAPLPNENNSGHYYTFKEMCTLEPEILPTGDSGMPSSLGCDLGTCEFCPSYIFFSKTEKAHHMKIFHPRHPKRRKGGTAMYICHYKISKDVECGIAFSSRYQLTKHRKSAGHLVKRRHSPKRNCSSVLNYVQSVKKIRLELDEEHTEDDEEMQSEEQTEKEEQDGMQLEGEEQNQSEEHGRDADELEGQDDLEDTNGMSHSDEVDGDSELEDSGDEFEEDSDNEPCVLCGEHDTLEDDVDAIDWIKCTECQEWMHESCLPHGYCFDRDDDDFACPGCLTGEKC